jgi:catechol 2,3-dioxygenase-like lactoylglutathione lyase family enzyme
MPFMIRGIHHTAISTADIERSLRFYRDLLGLRGGLLFCLGGRDDGRGPNHRLEKFIRARPDAQSGKHMYRAFSIHDAFA